MFFLVDFSALLWLIPWLKVFPAGFTGTSGAPERRESRSEAFAPRLDRNLLGIWLGFFWFGYYWYLLVSLVAGSLGGSAALLDPQSRGLRLAALFDLRCLYASGGLGGGPADRIRLG